MIYVLFGATLANLFLFIVGVYTWDKSMYYLGYLTLWFVLGYVFACAAFWAYHKTTDWKYKK